MIISSVISWILPQADGTSNVRETHTDDQGNEFVFDYQASPGMDVNARLAARAEELNAQEAPSPSPAG